MKKTISIIACVQLPDYGVGFQNKLLYSLAEDMKNFRTVTTGHAIIMGWLTWDSLPAKYKPLPGRINIVLSKDHSSTIKKEGGIPAGSLDEALKIAEQSSGSGEIFVLGGPKTWKEAFPRVEKIYLTEVSGIKEADSFFPSVFLQNFKRIKTENFTDQKTGLDFSITILERK